MKNRGMGGSEMECNKIRGGPEHSVGNSDMMRRKLVRLALPMAFQQFMLALVGASDAVMLGKLNQDAMSAVSLATQVTFVFNLFMMAFVIGENMFVAQYYGKRDGRNIFRVLCLTLRTACGVSVLFWMGTLFFPENIMYFFTNDRELIALGSGYLRVVGCSYFLSAVAQVHMTVMKNCGAVNVSTTISGVTVILNILLNGVFIFGLLGVPAMEADGAALATVLATFVQAAWSVAFVRKRIKMEGFGRQNSRYGMQQSHHGMPNSRHGMSDMLMDENDETDNIDSGNPPGLLRIGRKGRDGDLARRFWAKTTPVLLNELVWGGGFTIYSVIMGHMGTDAVAANSIANISKNLVICLCLGLGGAGSIIVGNELGASRFEKAKEAGRVLTKASIAGGVLSGLFLLALSPFIVRVVDLTSAAGGYLTGMLVICSYYLIGKSVNSMTIGGIFPAGGDARFGLICDAVTLWCIVIPFGCLCAFVWKLPVLTVYFVLSLDEIIKLPAVYRHYKKYGWLRNITN